MLRRFSGRVENSAKFRPQRRLFAFDAICFSLELSFFRPARPPALGHPIFQTLPIMNLRPKMLLVFVATVAGGMAILYILSRDLLLSSFRKLETDQMKQNVDYALTGLNQEFTALARTTNDYAYWDRTYNFMLAPQEAEDIGKEFQDATMDGLDLNLIALRDVRGIIIYAKAYDTNKRQAVQVPNKFLEQLFQRPQLSSATITWAPRD